MLILSWALAPLFFKNKTQNFISFLMSISYLNNCSSVPEVIVLVEAFHVV